MLDARKALADYAVRQGWKVPTVSVIIDEPNLRRSAKEKLGIRPDFKKILDKIKTGCWTVQNATVVTDYGDTRDEVYFQLLESQGFEVESVPGKKCDGTTKSRTDAFIQAQIVKAANETETIVLVSGDGDFEPVLRQIKMIFGTSVVIYTIRGVLAHSLFSVANKVEYIGEECAMYKHLS